MTSNHEAVSSYLPNAVAPFDASATLRRAWEILTSDFGPMLGATIVSLAAFSLAGSTVIGVLLAGPMLGGVSMYALKKVRGERAEISDLFTGFTTQLAPLLAFGVVSMVATGVGLVFCLLPGLYLMLAWLFAAPLIVERKLDFWPAMELSRQALHQHSGFVLTLGALQLALLWAGSMVFGVGLVIALPLCVLMTALASEQLFGRATSAMTLRDEPAGIAEMTQ